MTVSLSSPMFLQFMNPNNTGSPAAGFLLFTYVAGTSTKQATWTDSTQVTQNTNPIVLDANGGANVWGDPTLAYKYVLSPPNDTDPPSSPLRTVDNLHTPIDAAYLNAQNIGAIIFPKTIAETAASAVITNFNYQPYDIRRYGGDPTANTPSDTALATAIAVCGTTGGTIRWPAGAYVLQKQVDLSLKTSIIFQGDGTANGGVEPATQITYTGSATPWIKLTGASGCRFRDMQLQSTNASFTGTYIKAGHTGGADCTLCGITNCVVGSGASLTGNIHLDLDQTIVFDVDGCSFLNGNPSIRGQNSNGTSYSNDIKITRNNFSNGAFSVPIQDGGSAWTITNNSFEGLNTGAAGAVLSSLSTAVFHGLVFEGNWLGDVTAVVGSWIDIYGGEAIIAGNFFNGDANSTASTAIVLRNFSGAQICGNLFEDFLVGINFATTTSKNVVIQANTFTSVTTVYSNPGNMATGQLKWSPNFGVSGPPSGHGSFVGTSGYRVGDDGIIVNWGQTTVVSGTSVNLSFAKTFPNAVFTVLPVNVLPAAIGQVAFGASISTSGYTLNCSGSSTATNTVHWEARGN